jgi:hypothetical protein
MSISLSNSKLQTPNDNAQRKQSPSPIFKRPQLPNAGSAAILLLYQTPIRITPDAGPALPPSTGKQHRCYSNPRPSKLLEARSHPHAPKSNRAALVGLGERNSRVRLAEKAGEAARDRGGRGCVRPRGGPGLDQGDAREGGCRPCALSSSSVIASGSVVKARGSSRRSLFSVGLVQVWLG